MSTQQIIDVDLASIWEQKNKKGFIRFVGWGDVVEVDDITDKYVQIKTVRYVPQPEGGAKPVDVPAFIVPSKSSGIRPDQIVRPVQQQNILKVNFIDVQQGDGTVIETPQGKVVLIDGGDNQLFARYLAGRYRDSSLQSPREIECIVVTHGDADHFAGLTEIFKSESGNFRARDSWKKLFIHPKRVYHNGLVKRPSSVPEKESFGATAKVGDRTVIVALEENLLTVPDAQMNKPFLEWKRALAAYNGRSATPITFRRLARGHADGAFDFLAGENIRVEVLGPILTEANGVSGLRFLGNPPTGPHVGHDVDLSEEKRFPGFSASHTINGHSIVLRLTYGGIRFLMAGDLNEEAEEVLTRAHQNNELDLTADVFKVPHHGSADFSTGFLQAVAPIVSVVSSGDESARKEYIHPRATLMGTLSRHSRTDQPLVFVTELVAFFNVEGFISPEKHQLKDGEPIIVDGKAALNPKAKPRFFAFSRTAFGAVKMRTDGKRLMVYTDSGNAQLKEAYAYEVDQAGDLQPAPVRQV